MAFFGGANTGFGAPSGFQTPAFGGGATQTSAPFGGFVVQPQAGAPSAFGGAQSFTTPAFGAGAATFGAGGQGKGLQPGFQGGKDGNGDYCTVNSICARMKDQTLESQRFIDHSQGGAVAAPARGAVAESSGVCLNHLAHARHMSRALFCQHLTTVGLAVGDGNCLHLTGVEGPLGVRINGIPSPPSPPPRRVA